MILNLLFLILTLLSIDLAPSSPLSLTPLFLIFPLFFIFLLIQKRLLKRKRVRELFCLGELLCLALFAFYTMGLPAIWGELLFLVFYFVALGTGHNWHTVRFLFPFTLPFIVLSIASTLFRPLMGENLFLFFSLALFFLVLLFLPLVLNRAWKCEPLPDGDLKKRLEVLCQRHRFRYGKIMVWRLFSQVPTAAIIGILPRFRYILFTGPLLRLFPEEEIEAIFAHEAGHAVHKHLLIFPLLLLGLPVLGSLLYPLIEPLPPFVQFVAYGALLFCYIRFFIGFFSRSFERAADLHIFAFGLSSQPLVDALKRLSSLNLLPLKKRNWHHGSLQKRINFVLQAEQKPKLIQNHHTRVRLYLLGYICLLIIGFVYA